MELLTNLQHATMTTKGDLPGSLVDDKDQPPHETRAQVLQERRHNNLTHAQPISFRHVKTHPLDGGITPVTAVAVEPFWLDAMPITNKEFAKFVSAND